MIRALFEQWFDIIIHNIDCSSREVFSFDISISYWNSSFANARQHWIINYEGGISSLFPKVFIWIRWYMRIFYLIQFLLLFLTKFNKLLLNRNYLFIFYIPMLLCFFIPKSFTLSLTQYNISLLSLSFCFICICTAFDCYVISILCLKTSFSSSCINLNRLSILSFVKIITRFTWVSVPVIYHAYYIVDSLFIITQLFP